MIAETRFTFKHKAKAWSLIFVESTERLAEIIKVTNYSITLYIDGWEYHII